MRHPVNKQKSAKSFKNRAAKTHRMNVHQVRRGGIRL